MDVVLMIFALLALVALLVAGVLFRERFGWLIQAGLAAVFIALGLSDQGWQRWTWFVLAAIDIALAVDGFRKRRRVRDEAPASAPRPEGSTDSIG